MNSGSSSTKLRTVEDDRILASADLGPLTGLDAGELVDSLASMGPFDVIGHRFVHGGHRFSDPVAIDDGTRDALERMVGLAPLHQRSSLVGVDLLRTQRPGVAAFACFDTAFHRSIPAAASTFAIPEEWRTTYHLKRYGFHGFAHASVARRVAELTGQADLRIVSCHLGAGASLAAIRGERSVDTTMGFSPLDGLVMATRSGAVDPGAILWLLGDGGLSPEVVGDGLEHRSGLLGMAGTADMAEVLRRRDSGNVRAALAVDVYLHRLVGSIAAMTASLGGLDAITFSGGVGEQAAELRAHACDRLGFIGVSIELTANLGATGDAEIGTPGAPVRAYVIRAREDLAIAAAVRGALDNPGPAPAPNQNQAGP